MGRGYALESRQVLPAPWRRASLHVHGQLVVGRPVAREVPLPTSPQGHGAQDVSLLFSASSRIDSVSGEIQFECYKFDVEQHDVWTRIHCNLNSHSILPLAVGGHDSTFPP